MRTYKTSRKLIIIDCCSPFILFTFFHSTHHNVILTLYLASVVVSVEQPLSLYVSIYVAINYMYD